MEDKMALIKNNIKSLRVKRGLTQEETALLLGISRATYNDYETNPGNVKIETYNKMAQIFKCNLVDFFKISNATYSDNLQNIE